MWRVNIWQTVGRMAVCAIPACEGGPPSGTLSAYQSAVQDSKPSVSVGVSADASEADVSDANPQSVPGAGYCSPTLGPVSASEADAAQAFWCPGLCTMGPAVGVVPQGPAESDSAAQVHGPFSCRL